MVLTNQDSFQNQGLLLEIQDMTDIEDSSLNTINQEKAKIVIYHYQNRELRSLQKLSSIAVLDVTMETATK